MGHSICYATLPPPPMDGGFDRRGSDFSEIGLFGHVFKRTGKRVTAEVFHC